VRPYVIDCDDVTEDQSGMELLLRIKRELPKFKATLFVIPALCSLRFLREMRRFDWLDLQPHGWRHTEKECEDWSAEEMLKYIGIYSAMEFNGYGFKAPGWRLSDEAYKELRMLGWWIGDHLDHNHKRPEGLMTYLLDEPDRKFHFHVQNNIFKNGLEESLDMILALDKTRDFDFCRNETRPWKP
jgi:hypothetical protein